VWLVPFHAIGQGHGAGPAIWAVVSSPLLNILRAKGFGSKICCPLSRAFLKFAEYAFVNDTDIIKSALCDKKQDAIALLQKAIDTWENSLKITCGAIVPEKTVWWLIHFEWEGTFWRYASSLEYPGEIQVNDIAGDRKTLTRLNADQAYETLGVYLAPDGNSTAQFAKLLSLLIKWADAMRTRHISKDVAWLAVIVTIWRSLSYPLAALQLTKLQWEMIMAPILRYCLPAMGICQNFSRRITFSWQDFFGLGFKNLYTMQEITRIKIKSNMHGKIN
jgi:hypothetical protein